MGGSKIAIGVAAVLQLKVKEGRGIEGVDTLRAFYIRACLV